MAPEARVLGLQCLRCHARFEEPRLFTGCPRCRAQGIAVNLTVEYDLAPLAGVTPETFGTAARGLWRFRPLLPVRPAHPVSLGEGATPLVHLERLGRRLGLPRLYAKDESQNPTWSYKDRLCATAVTHAVETGARVITISSTGNHGASTAAYAARAGLPCVIFTLASVPETMKLGLVKHAPRMIAAEPFGPLAHALERGLQAPEPVEASAPSVAFSIASRYGTWQGLAALRDSGGAGVRLTDEGVLEAQRALAREEGLYVEPSSAASLTAVMQLAARRALDAEQTIVVVLTSGGLKDPGASRAWLPPVPAADGDFDRLLTVLREAYGLALDR